MDIYQYEDYRVYLGDMLEQEKADPSFSYRNFALKADLSNPGYINDVIKGRRRLSKAALKKIVKIFKLSPHEAEYLSLLTRFSHAKRTEDKDECYREIINRRNHSNFAKINPKLVKYYQDHRYPLVRSAIMTLDFNGDYQQISDFLVPSIPPHIVKKLLADLIEWNLITVNDDNKYTVTDEFVSPSPKLSQQVKEVNRKWIKEAETALLNLSPDDRHVSSMLLSVSNETRNRIFNKIEQFRNEIWTMVQTDEDDAECIMLLNNQFVPMSLGEDQK